MTTARTAPAGYWNRARNNWAEQTNYTFVLVVEGNDNYRGSLENNYLAGAVKYTNVTGQEKLARRKQDVSSDWSFNSLYNKRVHVIHRDTFNALVRQLKSGNIPTETIEAYTQGSTTVPDLKDKNVFIVWNKTHAVFVKAVATEAEALAAAKEAATKNTNQAFLVLRPDSIAYQPVSVTVDKVSI